MNAGKPVLFTEKRGKVDELTRREQNPEKYNGDLAEKQEKDEKILASILAGLVLVQEVETGKLTLNRHLASRHREIQTNAGKIEYPMTTDEIQHLIDGLNTGKKAIVDAPSREGA